MHAAAAARARGWFVVWGAWAVLIIVLAIRRRGRNIKQASAKRELVGAMAVGKEAVVPNAMEATRQYVEEKAADELSDPEPHHFVLVAAVFPIVLPKEADVGLIEIEQATVGDRDAMGVSRKIGQDLFGTGKGLFGIDGPCGCAQGHQSGGKCLCLVETDEISKELQFAGIECCRQTFEEHTSEQAGEHTNGKKGSRLAGNPTVAIRRNAATRNDAVNVRIYAERRIMPSWRRECCPRRRHRVKVTPHIFWRGQPAATLPKACPAPGIARA
jgi:hypothetical protein